MQRNDFPTFVRSAFYETQIAQRLASTSAIVLERMAMAAGATRWYYCSDFSNIGTVEANVSPGSVVSFYFDHRIRDALYSPEVKLDIQHIIGTTGEAVVGVLLEGGSQIDMDVITGLKELTEYVSTITPATRIFYGVFPARDNDGVNAVTLMIPDLDGIIRPHPH